MPSQDVQADPATPRKEIHFYRGEDARGGEIILRTSLRRAVFIAGLAGAVVLAVLLSLFALAR
ncbi:hypothetical protein [Methyloceanibacter sp.]|uniref:hypothetical protein n=1 Tax=Methyloceanibacter sp. TaxID=1965321 RepID=UPI002D4DDBFA|nr:hypothetical protein [Methyloceanibacter sp.]HZP09429.1 hypothetical protein [Methyloceanibacter sp.]